MSPEISTVLEDYSLDVDPFFVYTARLFNLVNRLLETTAEEAVTAQLFISSKSFVGENFHFNELMCALEC